MKKTPWQTTMFVAAILATSACLGQSDRGYVITNIPFQFVVANQTLPPGRYVVTHLGETSLRIYSDQNRGTVVQTHTAEGNAPEGSGKMVFHRYGETYVLSQVWFAADAAGRQVFRSRVEEELARTKAASELAVLQMGR